MIQKIVRDFMMIWTTIDPIGNVALFAALTGSLTAAQRAGIARRASIYATLILIVAVVLGQIILDLLHLLLHPLRLFYQFAHVWHKIQISDCDFFQIILTPLPPQSVP